MLSEIRQNNFDFIRFVAATMVWFGHSYELYDYHAPIREIHLNGWGVFTFFIISGYLVSWSYERHSSVPVFIKNRLLRIYPGFIVAIVWGALCIGPVVTVFSLHDYFFNSNLWDSFFSCILLAKGGLSLPGVFSDAIHKHHDFNGSIWDYSNRKCTVME